MEEKDNFSQNIILLFDNMFEGFTIQELEAVKSFADLKLKIKKEQLKKLGL